METIHSAYLSHHTQIKCAKYNISLLKLTHCQVDQQMFATEQINIVAMHILQQQGISVLGPLSVCKLSNLVIAT